MDAIVVIGIKTCNNWINSAAALMLMNDYNFGFKSWIILV